jgi:hypothetical protein
MSDKKQKSTPSRASIGRTGKSGPGSTPARTTKLPGANGFAIGFAEQQAVHIFLPAMQRATQAFLNGKLIIEQGVAGRFASVPSHVGATR